MIRLKTKKVNVRKVISQRETQAEINYYSTILNDNPIAFFKLDETSPSGAGSIIDTVGAYSGTPNGTITWRNVGPLADASGYSALFDGSTGYLTGGASLASALMNSANWSIEFWFYAARSNGGTIFAASNSGGSARVRIEHFSNTIYTSSTVGGNKSSPASFVISNWHHLVLTSAGDLYIDGVVQSGTSNTGLNSTNQLTIGCHNNASGFFNGRISCLSLYSSVLSSTQVNTHRNAGMTRAYTPQRTFYWDFETDIPNEFPAGSDDTASFDISSTRSTDQAYAGSYSLSVGGSTFKSVTFDNPTSFDQWCSPEEGTVKLKFRYTGSITTFMAFQITGKDRSGSDDTDDGVNVKFTSTSATIGYGFNNSFDGVETILSTTIAADTWHTLIAKWRKVGATNLYLSVDGNEIEEAKTIGDVACSAWHHLLIGNDTTASPTGMWIDEVEVLNYWE